jgi:uncharacterized protein
MCQLDKIRALRSEIYRIAQKHNAGKIYVFGSCARKEEKEGSDVDLIIELNNSTLFDHISMEEEISELLQTPVDIVSMKALKQDTFGCKARREMVLL